MAVSPYPDPATVQASRPGVAWDVEDFTVSGGDKSWAGGALPDSIRVDGAGTVTFVTAAGSTSVWTCVAADIIPCVVQTVKQSGTNATGLHALFTSANTHS